MRRLRLYPLAAVAALTLAGCDWPDSKPAPAPTAKAPACPPVAPVCPPAATPAPKQTVSTGGTTRVTKARSYKKRRVQAAVSQREYARVYDEELAGGRVYKRYEGESGGRVYKRYEGDAGARRAYRYESEERSTESVRSSSEYESYGYAESGSYGYHYEYGTWRSAGRDERGYLTWPGKTP